MARHGCLAALVDGALEPANQRVDLLLRGLATAGRRHEAPPQFVHGGLEDLGVLGHGLCGEPVEHDVAGANDGVVATDAVALHDGPLLFRRRRELLFGRRCELVRALGKDDVGNRDDTDGTRNADKKSSEFHTSHHDLRLFMLQENRGRTAIFS